MPFMRKRTRNQFMRWTTAILSVVVGVGVGGLFVNGTFTNVFLLEFLPLIVHQIVGWLLIAGAILKLVADLRM